MGILLYTMKYHLIVRKNKEEMEVRLSYFCGGGGVGGEEPRVLCSLVLSHFCKKGGKEDICLIY